MARSAILGGDLGPGSYDRPRRTAVEDAAQHAVDLHDFGNLPATNPAPVESNFKMLPDEGKPFNKRVINDKSWPNVDPLSCTCAGTALRS